MDPLLAQALEAHQTGRLEVAEGLYRQLLAHQPRNADASHLLGLVVFARGHSDEAYRLIKKAIALNDRSAPFHGNLGSVLLSTGRVESAVTSYRRAVALDPRYPDAWSNMAGALTRLERWSEAAAAYRRFLDLGPPRRGQAVAQMSLCLASDAAWAELPAAVAEMATIARRPGDDAVPPFPFLCQDTTAADQLACARKQAAAIEARMAPVRAALRLPQPPPPAGGRLRIGYLSNDYRQHATASLMAELFELHDRDRFEVAAFSYAPSDGSPMRARLEAAFDRFIDLGALPPPEAAAAIAAAGIHVLVDLKGYTADARPEILALRPAPVQAHYLGFPGTLGATFIDYLLADGIVAPAGREADFHEALVRLPACYQANDRKRPLPGDCGGRADHGLPADGLVLCCFNHPYKITAEMFGGWMRLLGAVPGSVLWLLEGNREALCRQAAAHGVEAGRLVFAPRLPAAEHLARYRHADLFLDTFPVNAHTTASDALWAGVPVVTRMGGTFVSRVAGSLLHAVGLPELATGSLAAYESTALELARSPERLTALKRHLAAARATAPLFDTPALVRALEWAYRRMWEIHAAGGRPQAFAVPADPEE